MAQLHLWDQETAAALVDVEAMLKVDPTSMTALGLAAAAHYLRHDAERLAEVERRSLAAHPKGGAFYNTLGSAALQVMRFDVAETWFKKAIELDPQLWSAVLNRGTVLIHLGREEEGRKLVEEGFEQDSFNTRAFNLIKLFRKMDKNMVLADLERFHLRVNSAEDPILTPYLTDWLRRADEELSKKYGFRPEGPILVEDFAVHNDFSVRTAGIPGLGALGACFGKVVTLILPTDANFRMTGEFNWARVFWHEYAHVVTLQLSKNRVPRWFTEGLSVYEEKAANPTWAREMELELYHAWKKGELLGIAELNRGFTRPKYPGQVLLCYYHSSLICEFIAATWGFAAIPKMLRAYGEDAGTEAVIRQVCGVTVGEFDKQFDAWLGRFYSSIVLPPLCSEAEAKKLEERVAKDGKDAAARVGLAWWNFGAGKLDEARDHARQALAVDPKSADALAVLGYLADGKKDAAEARKLLEAAVAAGVKYHGVYLRLGRLLLEAKEPEKALAALEKAKAAFPTRVAGNENPYALLAKLHEEAGRRDRMIAELEALRAIDQDDYGLRRRLAEIYQKEKKPADVARVLAEANEVRALDPSLHEAWATALRELGRWEEAVREFETAIAAWRRDTRGAEADEKVGALYCDLAEVRLAQGKPEEAARALDDAEYAFPKSERVKPLRAKLPGAAAPAEKAAPKPAEKPADGAPEKPPPAPGPGGDAGAGSAPK
ncbi:MAG: tetratricopeptide repeat protein [Planctomycetes bacterium]|nr:tetratricopeptide repeat protein [Planctomycetota bacterium]